MDNRNTWLKRLANLNVARTERRGLAPHKPLLLLALMDMIEDGNITSRWIAYSAELFFRFSCYWDVVYHRQLNRPDMRLPFHALGGHRDRIWERFTDERQPSRARETTRLCHTDESFWEALQDPAFRRAARIQLVATYFEPGEQIALSQQLGIPEPTTEAIAIIKQDAAEYKRSLAKGRDSKFRTSVLIGYQFTCALTGYRLNTTPESRVSLVIPRGGILLPRGLGPWRQPFVPGFALRSQPCPTPRWFAGHDCALKWLDGVWDTLCMSPPRLRDSRPFATAATRSRPRLPGTTRPRFALHGAQRRNTWSRRHTSTNTPTAETTTRGTALRSRRMHTGCLIADSGQSIFRRASTW